MKGGAEKRELQHQLEITRGQLGHLLTQSTAPANPTAQSTMHPNAPTSIGGILMPWEQYNLSMDYRQDGAIWIMLKATAELNLDDISSCDKLNDYARHVQDKIKERSVANNVEAEWMMFYADIMTILCTRLRNDNKYQDVLRCADQIRSNCIEHRNRLLGHGFV